MILEVEMAKVKSMVNLPPSLSSKLVASSSNDRISSSSEQLIINLCNPQLRENALLELTKVHMCNKLASRHVRVGLAEPRNAPCCDICENASIFFYCEIDNISLCLQCDMVVHVGGKRTHRRFLLLIQRIEFPGDKPKPSNTREILQNQRVSAIANGEAATNGKIDDKMIDMNSNPQRVSCRHLFNINV